MIPIPPKKDWKGLIVTLAIMALVSVAWGLLESLVFDWPTPDMFDVEDRAHWGP